MKIIGDGEKFEAACDIPSGKQEAAVQAIVARSSHWHGRSMMEGIAAGPIQVVDIRDLEAALGNPKNLR